MKESKLTGEQKDQMLRWVAEAREAEWEEHRIAQASDQAAVARPLSPWWSKCSDQIAALAFVESHLPHLLGEG